MIFSHLQNFAMTLAVLALISCVDEEVFDQSNKSILTFGNRYIHEIDKNDYSLAWNRLSVQYKKEFEFNAERWAESVRKKRKNVGGVGRREFAEIDELGSLFRIRFYSKKDSGEAIKELVYIAKKNGGLTITQYDIEKVK